jgi:hypothetical protein
MKTIQTKMPIPKFRPINENHVIIFVTVLLLITGCADHLTATN